MQKTYYITTLGCPKNQADSREMERGLLEKGYRPVDHPEKADLQIINTCAFVEEAKVETIDTILEAATIKEKNPNQKLIAVGCFSERYQHIFADELPEVDLYPGTGDYYHIVDAIEAKFYGVDRGGDPATKPEILNRYTGASQFYLPHAPLKISDGCNRNCSFCAIPTFRGSFQPVSRQEIFAEAQRLVNSGIRELDLVSQDSSYYGEGFVDILEQLHELEELHWIRLLYFYPDKKTEKILTEIGRRSLPRLAPYLDMPVQHVSSHLLKAMNRSGGRELYEDLFALAREVLPDSELRTSMILGFPGEEDEDVDEILDFIENTRVEKLALFEYSPEENTSALPLGEAGEESALRVNRVRTEHDRIRQDLRKTMMGREYECMVDEVNEEGAFARRGQDAPEIDDIVILPDETDLHPGQILKAKIVDFFQYDMIGERIP